MTQATPFPFPTTDWRLISQAALSGPGRDAALSALLTKYLPPMKRYVKRRWRLAEEQAEDLLQSFVAGKVLEQDLLARAQEGRGLFRSFLLSSLDNFALNSFRDRLAAGRAPREGPVASLEAMAEQVDLEPAAEAAADVFDIAWARHVLDLALQRTRRECEASGRERVWTVFEARVVGPTMEGKEAPSYATLREQFGFDSPEQASNLLVTAKRMYERNLRAVVAEYADDEADLEEELRRLRHVLSKAR